MDHKQSKAFIETVEGVQRIRGLAGAGKTIVLERKAAYLHAQHPEWRLAVTFHTRSLKDFYRQLIYRFSLGEQGQELDWERLRIVHAWGASGGVKVMASIMNFVAKMMQNISILEWRNDDSHVRMRLPGPVHTR